MKLHSLAIIANVQKSGITGGAEIFHEKLREAFSRYVDTVDLIEVPCNESTFEGILDAYQTCYDLDLVKYDGVLSSKAPTFAVTHPNHVCFLMHTIRVFYDMFDEISANPVSYSQRKLIFRMDRELLSPGRTKKVFTIGQEVSDRIQKYIGIDSTVLHPGMTGEGFFCGVQGDYIYMPGRLHSWKRVDLCVKAMNFTKTPVKLKIAGDGDQLDELVRLSAGNPKIEFLGKVSDHAMKQLYADALAVAFTPIKEDYGYILHEAFMSGKPVLTCTDSGEPARFVVPEKNGILCDPDPKSIAAGFDQLFLDRNKTVSMGTEGRKTIEGISWDNVVSTLLPVFEY